MADLARLLGAWGRDEEVLSGFFLSLGGGRTVALVEVLAGRVYRGEGTEVEARAQALALVSALSVGSAGWSSGQAARFVEQMTEHGRWPGAVGFLFGSAQTAPMGESFTVAMANQIDTFERVNGSPAYWEPSDGHVLANLLFPDRAGRGTDPMSGVLETLGKYPGAALDWLLEGATETSVPRIAYWVGQREWRADGHLGIAALWSGVQHQPGGPLDVEHYVPLAWEQLAKVNAAFGRGLLDNGGALPENFSVEAQVNLATALGQMMPLLAHSASRNSSKKSGLTEDYAIFVWATDGTVSAQERAIPLLKHEHLARLFGLAASSHEGGSVLAAAVRHSQESLLHAALTARGYDPDSALGQVAALQALLDGAGVGSVQGIGQRAADNVASLVDHALTVVELVPLPGSGKAAGWLAERGGEVLGEKFARWAAEAALDKSTAAAREQAAAAITNWLTEQATAGAVEGTWLGRAEPPEWEETRADLMAFLDEWIVVLDDANTGPVTEFTRHVDQDSETLTASYEGLWKLARTAASS